MNNKEFVAELSQRMGYKADQTQKLLLNVLNAMGDSFQEGDAVQIPNFGAFEVKKKMERIIVGPTGKRMLVPPKLVLGFKPNAVWKDKIKNGGDE
jgi:DNA-binding protein HU-beta/integration host factor subunit alpha